MTQIEDSTTQTIGTALILVLSQVLPSWIGYKAAAAVSRLFGNRVLDLLHHAERLDQRVARNGKLTRAQLPKVIRQIDQIQGRILYDFYELLLNVQNVLRIAEDFIRLDHAQWMIFLPIWTNVESELPLP